MTAARLGMIDVEWRTGVEGELGESLERLLAEAASEDAEAGFPSFSLHDAVPEGTRYLLIWLLPDERTGRDEPPPTLAGCLRLEPSADDAGAAEVRLVIHPGLRSRGISTSLCEQVGLDVEPGGGWAGTGFSRLHCWARGDHPAAQRMSLRFARTGLRRARREWRLLALLRRATDPAAAEAAATTDLATTDVAITRVGSGDGAGSAALEALWRDSGRSGPAPNAGRVLITGSPDAPDGAVWFDPTADEPTEFGPAGLLRAVLVRSGTPDSATAAPARADGGRTASLLAAAMTAMREAGAGVAAITVADHEEALLTACRLAGFQHDRTDCEYVLG